MTTLPWKIRLHQRPRDKHPTMIRVRIGRMECIYPAQARAIADKLHDLADRLEEGRRR